MKPTPKLADRIGSFTAVPNAFINDMTISKDAFRLFVVLRQYTNSRDDMAVAFPSYDTLRERMGRVSFRTVAQAVKELEAKGWIERRKRFGQSTIYTITSPCSPTNVGRTEDEHSPTNVGRVSPTNVGRTVLPTLVGKQEPLNKTNSNKTKREPRPRPQLQAPAHLRNQKPANAKRPAWLGPEPEHPALVLWHQLTQQAPLNKVQEDEIKTEITDCEKWERILRKALRYHSKPHAATFVDYYKAGDVPVYSNRRQTTGHAAKPTSNPNVRIARNGVQVWAE